MLGSSPSSLRAASMTGSMTNILFMAMVLVLGDWLGGCVLARTGLGTVGLVGGWFVLSMCYALCMMMGWGWMVEKASRVSSNLYLLVFVLT